MSKTPIKASVSLKSLDARAASETPFKFPFLDANGEETGVVLHVLGGQSKAVTEQVNRMMNDRRKATSIRELAAKTGGRKQVAEFELVEDDIEFGQLVASVRLVGWDGIDEPYTPELAHELICSNIDVANQVAEQSGNMANFMKASSPA
ncbi:MAG: hypothetical protein ACOVKC_07855 [Brevundimonas sp.]